MKKKEKKGKQLPTLEENILERYNKLTKEQKELIARIAKSEERRRVYPEHKNDGIMYRVN